MKYRIQGNLSRSYRVESRPDWWPFWVLRDFAKTYQEAQVALDRAKSLDAGIKVEEDQPSIDERVHDGIESATATLRAELAKAQATIQELEASAKTTSL